MSPGAQGWPVCPMKKPKVMHRLRERQSDAYAGSSSLDSFQTVTITGTEVWPDHNGAVKWWTDVHLLHGLQCSLADCTAETQDHVEKASGFFSNLKSVHVPLQNWLQDAASAARTRACWNHMWLSYLSSSFWRSLLSSLPLCTETRLRIGPRWLFHGF